MAHLFNLSCIGFKPRSISSSSSQPSASLRFSTSLHKDWADLAEENRSLRQGGSDMKEEKEEMSKGNRKTKGGDARYFSSVTSAQKPQSDIKTDDHTALVLQGRCFDLQTAGTPLTTVVNNRKHIFRFVKYSGFITFGLKGQSIFSIQTLKLLELNC